MGTKQGVGAAVEVAQTVEQRRETEREAAQQAMLPLGERGAEPPEELAAAEPARRGPGRPPGARNKRTVAVADYILSRYRDPLIVLAETYSRPTAELAEILGCTPKEAFLIQQDAAEKLAPYVRSRQPIGVAIDSRQTITLQVGTIDAPAAVGDGETVTLTATVGSEEDH